MLTELDTRRFFVVGRKKGDYFILSCTSENDGIVTKETEHSSGLDYIREN